MSALLTYQVVLLTCDQVDQLQQLFFDLRTIDIQLLQDSEFNYLFTYPTTKSFCEDLTIILTQSLSNHNYVNKFLLRQLIVKLEFVIKNLSIGINSSMLELHAILCDCQFKLIDIYSSFYVNN